MKPLTRVEEQRQQDRDDDQRGSARARCAGRAADAATRPRARAQSRSSGLPRLLAEQALRPEDHDQDQVGEHDRRRPLGRRCGCRRSAGCTPMIRPPSTAPRRLPMPPMTAAVNAIRPAWKPWKYQIVGLVERVDQAGGAGHQAAEQEGQRDRGVDVDAHQPRGLRVLGGRAHRLAEPAARDERGRAANTSGMVTPIASTSRVRDRGRRRS